jgi:hypothetical protein
LHVRGVISHKDGDQPDGNHQGQPKSNDS